VSAITSLVLQQGRNWRNTALLIRSIKRPKEELYAGRCFSPVDRVTKGEEHRPDTPVLARENVDRALSRYGISTLLQEDSMWDVHPGARHWRWSGNPARVSRHWPASITACCRQATGRSPLTDANLPRVGPNAPSEDLREMQMILPDGRHRDETRVRPWATIIGAPLEFSFG